MQTSEYFQNNINIPKPIIEILFNRGWNTAQKIQDFFSWDLKQLPDLTQLLDLEKASLRIIKAIKNNQKIAVYGDYDVDGVTSCSLLFHYFKMLNYPIKIYQPSRFIEGYGVHAESLEKAKADNIDVLITVDCGISSSEACLKALELGIDLIITDHHQDSMPQPVQSFASINPNRRDETCHEELKTLAGVGVAFCLCLKIKMLLEKENQTTPSIYPLLAFVAIGTIADMAKLTKVNLILVRHGLKELTQMKYEGLKVFFEPKDQQLPFIPSEKISFHLGPLLNAKGRLDHPSLAVEVLTTEDHLKALYGFRNLVDCNQQRKSIQKEIFENALNSLKGDSATDYLCMCQGGDWNEGVIGIVASKLVEQFKVPSLVFTKIAETGLLKGSARSAGNLDLFKLLNEERELMIKFGGHKAAAGMTIEPKHFEQLKNNLLEKLKKIDSKIRTSTHEFDLMVNFSDLTPAFAKSLEMMEPFGLNNQRPIFRCQDVHLKDFTILKETHIKWNFQSKKSTSQEQINQPMISGISFNYLKATTSLASLEELKSNQSRTPLTIDFNFAINRFNGREILQLQVKNIFPTKLN